MYECLFIISMLHFTAYDKMAILSSQNKEGVFNCIECNVQNREELPIYRLRIDDFSQNDNFYRH